MMKVTRFPGIYLILFGLVLFTTTARAQKTDSLINLLRTAKDDTNKVRLYQHIALNLLYSDLAKAEVYIDRSLDLSQKLDHKKSLADAYNLKGVFFSQTGNSNKAELYLNRALALFQKIRNKNGQINTMDELGLLFFKKEMYDRSLKYRLKALMLAEETGEKMRIARLLTGLAGVYGKIGQYAEAEKYHLRNLKLRQEMGDRRGESLIYTNMGSMFYEADRDSIALVYLNKALDLQKEFKDNRIILACNETKASILVNTDNFQQALAAYNRCYEIYAANNDSMGRSRMLIGRAGAKYFLGDCSGSEKDCLEGLKLRTDTSYTEWTRAAYYGLCLSYSCMGEHEKAHNYLDRLLKLNQDIFNSEISANMAELRIKYEAEKKEKDNQLLREQNKTTIALAEKNRLWTIIISVLALVLLLILFLIIAINRNKRKQKQIGFIKMRAELEQTALRAQMNPHFIFNALNSIQHYILNGDAEYAYDYLAKFGKLIRQILINSEHDTIVLTKEIETLRLYLELEQRRFKNRFDFEINYADDFPASEINIPTMLIQPFVENAIWHGIMNLDKNIKGKLQLDFYLQDTELNIVVTDNGVGRKEAALRRINNEYQSVGVAFTQKRLELMQVVSKNKTTIQTSDLYADEKPAGTRVDITIEI